MQPPIERMVLNIKKSFNETLGLKYSWYHHFSRHAMLLILSLILLLLLVITRLALIFAVISGALLLRNELVQMRGGRLGVYCRVTLRAFIDRYGRKPGFIIAALHFALSSVGMAKFWSNVFFNHVLFQPASKWSALSPMYIVSKLSLQLRYGGRTYVNQLTICISILVTNLIKLFTC